MGAPSAVTALVRFGRPIRICLARRRHIFPGGIERCDGRIQPWRDMRGADSGVIRWRSIVQRRSDLIDLLLLRAWLQKDLRRRGRILDRLFRRVDGEVVWDVNRILPIRIRHDVPGGIIGAPSLV